MILSPPRNLNTFQAIIHRALPALQLQPSIRAIREKQRVPREFLHSLRVELLGGSEVAVLESLVALLFESVGGGGHRTRFECAAAARCDGQLAGEDREVSCCIVVVRSASWYCIGGVGAEVGKVEWMPWFVSGLFGECGSRALLPL